MVAALLFFAGPARADVSFTEHTVDTTDKHPAETETRVSIKASRVRIETKDGGEMVAAIYDIDNGRQIILRSKQKEAAVSDFTEQSAEVENKKFAPETTFAPTGKSKDILGKTCAEYSFSIRVPVFEELAVDLLVTGSVFVMRGTPESQEFADFVRRAQRQNLIWGLSSDNAGAVALARAQTELYQQVAAIGGIPLEADKNIQFQGGYWSKPFVKGNSGDKSSTVTAISSDPLPDAQFMVPRGWRIHTQ